MFMVACLTAALVLVTGVQNDTVDFVPSPGQTIADSFVCEPTHEGQFPTSVIVIPPGDTEPVQSAELVGPALDQVFNNGPSVGVVMDFCA